MRWDDDRDLARLLDVLIMVGILGAALLNYLLLLGVFHHG